MLANTSGFVYYVSIAGITGTAAPDVTSVGAHVGRIKARTDLPIAIGFGVKSQEQVRDLAAVAEGVVVGSALVSAIADTLDKDGRGTAETEPKLLGLVQYLSEPLRQRAEASAI